METKINPWEQPAEFAMYVHGRSVAKGFWDYEHENYIHHNIVMIDTELMEAVQADRNNRVMAETAKPLMQNGESVNDVLDGIASAPDDRFPQYYEEVVEGTLESEMVDALLRIFDVLGRFLDLHPSRGPHKLHEVSPMMYKGVEFTEAVYLIMIPIHESYNPTFDERMLRAIANIKAFADCNGIDLLRHIELKMRYNETRPRLHGKKY